MVTTRRNSDDDVPNFEAMSNAAMANALPNLRLLCRTQIHQWTSGIGAGTSGGCGGDAAPRDFMFGTRRFTTLNRCVSSFASCEAAEDVRSTRIWRSYFSFGLSLRQLQTCLAAFKLEGDALSWWKAHLRTQVGGDAFAILVLDCFCVVLSYTAWIERILGSTWRGLLDWLVLLELLPGDAQRQARHFKWGLKKTGDGPTGEQGRYEPGFSIEYRGRQDQVLRIGVVRIGVMIRNNRIFGVRIRGFLVGMGMTARVRVTTTSASTGVSQLGSTETLPPPPLCTTCGKPHPGVCYKATGGCFTCGSTQHKVKDCPQGKQRQSMPADFARLPPTTGRVYATTRDQAAKTSGTITGILYIDDRTVFVLFDTGATHSIISTAFAKKLNMTPTPLIERIIISTPMKNHILIDHEYVNCPLRFDDRIRSANLLPIHMFDFDVILGMDWLASHRATIDCYARTVIFGNVRQPEFVYHGSSPLKSP
ncbi:reverse transcriptase domain-containing protein [Tanacetum coccineum]